jgi:peptidyl-prolyl cis-trans isomerase C
MKRSFSYFVTSKRNKMKILSLMLAALMMAGCAQNPKGDVVARFGKEVITKDEVLSKFKSLPKDLRGLAAARKKEFVEDLAAEHYLFNEAMRQGLDKNKDVRQLIEAARRKIIIAKLIENEVDRQVQLNPDDALQYYDTHKEEFMTPLLFRASHILVKTQAEADALEAELATGADFEELARKHSLDMTAIRGGDLGFFQKGQFVPEFEQAVFQLKKGQISAPVKTQFGVHVIKLTDRAEPTLRDFRAVRALIQERLLNEKRTKRLRVLLERLKGNTKVVFDDKALEAAFGPQASPTKDSSAQ